VRQALINDRPRWQRPGTLSLGLEPGVLDLWRIRLGDSAPRENAREALGQILRHYIASAPGQTPVLARHPDGKPYLADPPGLLEFNLSHSHGLAVVAVSASHPVGIDVEMQRKVEDPLRIAGRVWTAPELAWLQAQPPALHQASFFIGWTRFEARQKMAGRGIFAPPVDTGTWSERVFMPAEGYVACVAVADRVIPGFRHFDHMTA